MRWRTRLCLATCGLLIATTVLAQGFRGPGPGGPRGPGFGGPGFGDPLGSIALLGMPEVQQELKLSDDQKPKVGELLGKVLDKLQSARFAELQLQRGGVGSLLRDEIGKQLKLNDEQRDKLRELIGRNPPFFAAPEQRQKVETDAVAVL